MTKYEFIIQAMLQMAANPKYVTIVERVDDDEKIVKFPSIDAECVFIDAEALANEAEKRMDYPFDDDGGEDRSIQSLLGSIVDDIEKPTGNTLSVFQELVKQFEEINTNLGKIVGRISDLAEV